MTEAEHAEISRRLALAIGWPEYRIGNDSWGAVFITAGAELPLGRFLDYRDPSVIWRIAERFNCFPIFHQVSGTWAVSPGQWMAREDADTAALAVALAVIKSKDSK